jgi:hypothetical protein
MSSPTIDEIPSSTSAEKGVAADDLEEGATNPKETKLERVLTREDGVEYPSGLRLGLVMLALFLAVFLLALVCLHIY